MISDCTSNRYRCFVEMLSATSLFWLTIKCVVKIKLLACIRASSHMVQAIRFLIKELSNVNESINKTSWSADNWIKLRLMIYLLKCLLLRVAWSFLMMQLAPRSNWIDEICGHFQYMLCVSFYTPIFCLFAALVNLLPKYLVPHCCKSIRLALMLVRFGMKRLTCGRKFIHYNQAIINSKRKNHNKTVENKSKAFEECQPR